MAGDGSVKLGPGARNQCENAMTALLSTPLHGCQCKRGMKKEKNCLSIYWSLHQSVLHGKAPPPPPPPPPARPRTCCKGGREKTRKRVAKLLLNPPCVAAGRRKLVFCCGRWATGAVAWITERAAHYQLIFRLQTATLSIPGLSKKSVYCLRNSSDRASDLCCSSHPRAPLLSRFPVACLCGWNLPPAVNTPTISPTPLGAEKRSANKDTTITS